MQHLNVAGPGHWLVSVLPEEQEELGSLDTRNMCECVSYVKRQLPLLPVPQAVLLQHLMSSF